MENAIIHGIQTIAAGGCIEVCADVNAGCIQLTISTPINSQEQTNREGVRSAQKHRQSGIALNNLRGRLQLRYSGAARLATHIKDRHHYAEMWLPLEH